MRDARIVRLAPTIDGASTALEEEQWNTHLPFNIVLPGFYFFLSHPQALTLVLVVAGKPQTQERNVPSQLSLITTENGFKGVFTFDGRHYPIENSVGKRLFRTEITDSGGKDIVLAGC